ncbi:hypothetical protein DLM_2382 [Aquitalea magnusonii]|uniref:Uncharacterized protein n=1 Tax=Aquitalea magnusonii TaxID=332411 RepID=A0A3G9GGM2_9NEIS|nr:hypothetical protein DLM_2382 [Aquitalea magnusonii]
MLLGRLRPALPGLATTCSLHSSAAWQRAANFLRQPFLPSSGSHMLPALAVSGYSLGRCQRRAALSCEADS